mgnify:CR=1 FL=1
MRKHKVWLSLVVLIGLLTASCVQSAGSTETGAAADGTPEKATDRKSVV